MCSVAAKAVRMKTQIPRLQLRSLFSCYISEYFLVLVRTLLRAEDPGRHNHMPEAETPFALSAFGTSRPFETFVSAALTSQACRPPPPPSCHKVYIAPTSDANQEQPSALEHHAYTADNTISLGGIDVEALNALARNVQERLKGGFGDFHEVSICHHEAVNSSLTDLCC